MGLAKTAEPFVCGGSAAAFASVVIHPIDLAKVRFSLDATFGNEVVTVGWRFAPRRPRHPTKCRQCSEESAGSQIWGLVETAVGATGVRGSLPTRIKRLSLHLVVPAPFHRDFPFLRYRHLFILVGMVLVAKSIRCLPWAVP